jgi:hypothetical protein
MQQWNRNYNQGRSEDVGGGRAWVGKGRRVYIYGKFQRNSTATPPIESVSL